MTSRRVAVAALTGAFVLSTLSGAVAAQDEAAPTDVAPAVKTITGTLTEIDGAWYVTPADSEPIALSFGPSWFGDLDASFDVSDGDTGVVLGGTLIETASDEAEPVFRVQTVDGRKRAHGKPAWAGGPKAIGEVHPGYEEWAEDQAAGSDEDPAEAGTLPPGLARKAGDLGHGTPGGGGNRIPLADE